MQRADKPGLNHTIRSLMQHECFSIRCGNCCSRTVGGKARGKNAPFGVVLSVFSESGQVPDILHSNDSHVVSIQL